MHSQTPPPAPWSCAHCRCRPSDSARAVVARALLLPLPPPVLLLRELRPLCGGSFGSVARLMTVVYLTSTFGHISLPS